VGTDFVYGGDPFQVVGLYLLRKMGRLSNLQALGSVRASQFRYDDAVLPMCMSYLKERVNSRPGVWKWAAIDTTPNMADPAMGGGSYFTTMEFARMGQFLLNRGSQTHGGTPVISGTFMDLMTAPTPYADPDPSNPHTSYARGAWIGYAANPPITPSVQGTPPVSLYGAVGAGKNCCWVLPGFRIVVARNAPNPEGTSLKEHDFFVALGLTDP
jgi:hypothetical protein